MYKHTKFNGKSSWDKDLISTRKHFYEPEYAKYIIPPPPEEKKKKKLSKKEKKKSYFRTQVVNWLNNSTPLYKKDFIDFMNSSYKSNGEVRDNESVYAYFSHKLSSSDHFKRVCDWFNALEQTEREKYLKMLNKLTKKKEKKKDKKMLNHPLNRIYYGEEPLKKNVKKIILRKKRYQQ